MKWNVIKRMGYVYIDGKKSEELLMLCDNCDKTVIKGMYEEMYNYCPYCGAPYYGAKMDKREENEN